MRLITNPEVLAEIERQPRVKIVFGRMCGYGPDTFEFGAYWDKDPVPIEGNMLYRRRFVLRVQFRAWVGR